MDFEREMHLEAEQFGDSHEITLVLSNKRRITFLNSQTSPKVCYIDKKIRI